MNNIQVQYYNKFYAEETVIYLDGLANGYSAQIDMIMCTTDALTGHNTYTYECSVFGFPSKMVLPEHQLMSLHDWQNHMNSQIPKMPSMPCNGNPPKNKFSYLDVVVYTDFNSPIGDEARIISETFVGGQWFYDILLTHNQRSMVGVNEANLFTFYEWTNRNNQGKQYSVGVNTKANFNYQNGKADWKSPHSSKPKCECGAHKVKDSAHAQWCDIKD